MPAFRNAREVYDLIGSTLDELLRDPALTWRLRQMDTSVRIDYRNPDAAITVTMRRDEPVRVSYGDEAGPAEVCFTADADAGHRFWLGGLDLTIALARGDMRAEGPVWKVLQLAPLSCAAFSRYRRRLESTGREDLLAVA